MGDSQRPRPHVAALFWVVYITDLCSKRCDRLLDRLTAAQRSGRRRRAVPCDATLPPGRSLT